MRPKLLILVVLASVCLAPRLLAGEEHGPALAPVKPGTHATIRCTGVFQVPMTEDAERAIPLRIVGGVSCGEQVTVISDSRALTVEIRTADGKDGYVERSYLSEAPASAPKAQPAESSADSGIARWQPGAAGSQKFFSNGSQVESLNAEGITVQVFLQDTGRKLRASVAIANHSAEPAQFDPARFTLDELTPRLRSLAYENPRGLFKGRDKQVSLTSVGAAAPSMTADEGSEYKDAAQLESTPNYLATDTAQAPSRVLTASTLAPNEEVSGVVWFAGEKKLQELTLRVFVGDQIFEFPLSFAPQN